MHDSGPPASNTFDLICLSHLRWNFVFQRPQHLLTRAARERRVFYVEEPLVAADGPRLALERRGLLTIATPHVPDGLAPEDLEALQRQLLDDLIADEDIDQYVLWFYTPMALAWTNHLTPQAIVYDCMDELSAFKNAPTAMRSREAELLARADLVFAGGRSLCEAKQQVHPQVHLFPSSVDVAHFSCARAMPREPEDQQSIPRPRLGFFGVLDERLDVDLLAGVAAARPDWHLVLLGPIVKIDPDRVPRAPNIHYLGSKPYESLPEYISQWDVAVLWFARNEATRFISPTKTPEYLAAGKPVVSTSIRDVQTPYGDLGLVRIADTVDAFVAACEGAMADHTAERQARADAFLRQSSWDSTWTAMRHLLYAALESAGDGRAEPALWKETPCSTIS
jgi:glycosyltransferase involved in cell wall biosynthesis